MSAVMTRVDKALVRREFWENRSLWLVPVVVAGILAVLSLYMVIAVIVGHARAGGGDISALGDIHFSFDNMPDFRDADDNAIRAFVRGSTFFLGFIFSALMQVVVFFYLLDSLYAERRDRSVLFWRSMPVSDTRTVLAKLATALISVTAVTFVVTVAFQLVLLVLQLILGTDLGVHPFVVLEYPGTFLGSWLLLAYALIVQAVWFLPYYGWVLLASGWAKKFPILWAGLVPLGVMFAEAWVFHTGHLARLVFEHKYNWLPLAFNIPPDAVLKKSGGLALGDTAVDAGNLVKLLGSPELWIGTALAAAFVYGAIWLRRNRSEI